MAFTRAPKLGMAQLAAMASFGLALGACATAENVTPTPPLPDAPLIDGPDIDAPIDSPVDVDAADAVIEDAPPDAVVDAPTDGGTGTTCEDAQDITAAASQPGGTVISGDTTNSINNVTTPSSCTGYATDGEDDVYRIVVVAGDRVAVTMHPTTDWDVSVQLISTCGDVACVIGRDQNYSGEDETFVYNFTSAGTFYIVADGYNPGIVGPYTLTVVITHP